MHKGLELPTTKEYFELLFNVVPSAIFAVDKDRRVTRWNKKAEEITGYSSGEMIGEFCTIFAEYPCKDKCGLFSEDVKKPIVTKECTIKTKGGQLRTILKNADLLKDDKGNIIGGIESFEDITERKVMEERLRDSRSELELRVRVRTAELSKACEDLQNEINKRKKAEEMLKESEEKYRSFVQNFKGITFQGDFNFVPIFFHGTVEAITGYTEKEFVAGNPKWSQIVHPDDLAVVNEEKERKKLHSIAGYSLQREYRIIRKDGQIRWINEVIQNICEKSGKPILVQGVIIDVTKHKKAEQELNKEIIKSNKRLKQLSLRDSHTGLYNHRYLQEVIEAEFQRARRYAHPLTVIMLDIDYFKSINDVYGHQFGDLVLKQFARQLKRMLRRYDIIIRFGGEEFIIVSPGTDRQQAIDLAQRLLGALNICNFGDKQHTVKLKLSLAVATYPDDGVTKGTDLINIADQILNKVKEFGGNRVYSSMDIKKQKTSRWETRKENVDINLLKAKIDKLTKRANQSLVEAIFAFAKTIELKDHYTGEHVEMTVKYAKDIARRLGLSTLEIEQIGEAAILHDLGKIGISENILLKKLKLTKKEFEEIRKHPQIGADIIRPVQFLHNLIPFIFYHHERWDGKGYPSRMKGEEIPIGARIIAIADVYQALTSDRPYRKAHSKKEAIKIIKNSSGTQFDPGIVDVFLKILQEEEANK